MNRITTQISLIIMIFFLCLGMLFAQDKGIARIPPDGVIQTYLVGTKEYAALYNGKIETPFDRRQFVNHAFLATDQYMKGVLCYNQVVYQDIYMRLDLFRDELTVILPEKPYRVVLEKEKFNYAVLNGYTIITSIDDKPDQEEKYRLLIDNGSHPFVKKYYVTIRNELSNTDVKRHFRFQEQYLIYIDGVVYPVKNKNSLCKLFPDRKKELNEYARQHKLDFKAHFEQSVIALVNHYETFSK